ncbi:pullulanase [Streptococcus porcinus]|uniref:pullulanase n=1 Tax=Streptococcus porcinus str. Jelinkova 176 TaxID=873448 RepID=A0ABP2KWC6_STRPO|nr:pullulanase [Streptococcus porcinus]EGJ26401.1 pullulanase, extracellular [Streptococcus porcinus str. Jelinkova 176]SQG42759.1 peptidoglycan linked protein (LPXTG motif), pullulanase [Streptococcus porcinus]
MLQSMIKHNKAINLEKRQKFGIRRLKVGIASTTIATGLFFTGVNVVQAQAVDTTTSELLETATSDSSQSTSLVPSFAETNQALITETKSNHDKSLPTSIEQPNHPSSDQKDLISGASASISDASIDLSKTVSDLEITTPSTTVASPVAEIPIAATDIRMHFKTLPSKDLASLGLWTWEDVAKPSEQNGAWPTGATSFSTAKQDDYGYYIDIKMAEGPRDLIKWLINDTSGQNITGDQGFDILSQNMNEVWFDDKYKASYYEPQAAGTLRINYLRTDGNYKDKSLWLWGSVDPAQLSQQGTWPDGINFTHFGKYGAYIDIKLSELPSDIGFLLLDESKSGESVKINPSDYKFTDFKNNTQIFVKDEDPTIYTNPYYVNNVRILGAQQTSPTTIEVSMTSLEGTDQSTILKNLTVTNAANEGMAIAGLVLNTTQKSVLIKGDFSADKGPYTVTYASDHFLARGNWQYKDALYAYDGFLGSQVTKNGLSVDMAIWSPSADQVSVVLYDKEDQNLVIGKVGMVRGDKGQWTVKLDKTMGLGINDYRGYYYHYEIKRGDKSVLVLDPYAKSLAEWNSDLATKGPAYAVAKAALVDPGQYGPKELTYAKIPGFNKREDAIIYEAHVRDFTSDKAISADLQHQFGTFAAFAERLQYLKELGVTHIQLLPVMSYYFINEMNKERMDNYASSATNYNWGYDPQSYFALTGNYSSDPKDPTKRIEEFKNLVNEIHKLGMGVLLDVVYNHTAKTAILEDLEPHYYHFMDADGTPRTAFGGGRVGTTHYMTRRLLLDSIKYMVSEYKVDGFRFDMMGEHDAETIQAAYDAAKALNPQILMLGEGWITYAGDENKPVQPADQTWMNQTDSVASFSDDIRNLLKSGYPNEGQPAFLTNGSRSIHGIFSNIKGQPTNFKADDPGDVIQYIEAHDNLTLFDIIAQSIKKDPSIAKNNSEIHRRLRLGNLIVMTSQGTAFIHAGQEYGRTKQFRDEAYKYPVSSDLVPNKSHLLVNEDGSPFDYPYFIHDSYDSTDAINHFDWTKATNSSLYPENTKSHDYMQGLIAIRKSTDAFRLGDKDLIDQKVSLITIPGQDGVSESDLIIGYMVTATNGDRYAVLVNADSKARHFTLPLEWQSASVLVDADRAGLADISHPKGLHFDQNGLSLDALTATILKLAKAVEGDSSSKTSEEVDNRHALMTPQPTVRMGDSTIATSEDLSASLVTAASSSQLVRDSNTDNLEKGSEETVNPSTNKKDRVRTETSDTTDKIVDKAAVKIKNNQGQKTIFVLVASVFVIACAYFIKKYKRRP